MKATRFVLCAAIAASAASPVVALAQGFGLNEIGACAIARGFAVTGAPCEDASVIYWNPAAATMLKGTSVYAGAATIAVGGDFTQDFSTNQYKGNVPIAIPPHLFATRKIGQSLSLGVGAYVPYGLTSQWFGDFPGRFSAQKASLQTIYLQPNIAYDVVPGRLSIGAGPVIGYSKVELVQGVDLSSQIAVPNADPTKVVRFGQFGIPVGTEFAEAKVKGSAVAYGVNVGVHATITPSLQFGARYLSKLDFKYDDADATFSQRSTGLILGGSLAAPLLAGTPVDAIVAGQFVTGGALVPQKVSTAIAHPAQAQAGLGYTLGKNTTLSADYAWIGWKAFKDLPVNFAGPASGSSRTLFEDYDNSSSYRFGLQQSFTDFIDGLAARVGYSHTTTPAPDFTVTPLLPDQDRNNYAFGLAIPFGGVTVDASYLKVDTDGRRGRVVERTDRAQTADQLNSGFYRLNANIFSLSLRAQF